jgi:hypothetical protein
VWTLWENGLAGAAYTVRCRGSKMLVVAFGVLAYDGRERGSRWALRTRQRVVEIVQRAKGRP